MIRCPFILLNLYNNLSVKIKQLRKDAYFCIVKNIINQSLAIIL